MVRQWNIILDARSQLNSTHPSELINAYAASYGIPAANIKLQPCNLATLRRSHRTLSSWRSLSF
ncbi:hypothetical protein CY34DRAFT_811750 [Suillus luteus UH-Slu-Lm8-n1]|uniref:Uncharacterized protein n=1 Tax=Suillus luteus UH-Slu-Lm8-n1 TaxID=930992 RepID=A0A0C9ZEP2_9AGAM|nr:hypothetical protein CY34DRAFT_811750 [Suillus luteus UH-Slu-Lm8-n1]